MVQPGLFSCCFLIWILFLTLAAFTPLQKRLEQRATIKFLQKSGFKCAEIWRRLRGVFQGDVLSRTQTRYWFDRFKAGTMDTTTKDRPRPGCPRGRDRHRAKIGAMLNQDRRHTLKDMSLQTGVSVSTVHRIVHKDLRLSKLSCKFIPKLLTAEQQNFRLRLCQENLALLNRDNTLMEKVITMDESWFHKFEPETKQTSSQWLPRGSKRPTKVLRSKTTTKTMCILFFDSVGVVHLEFLPR